MGLILPQKVIVKWNNMNMQRFIDKGYTYTGYHPELKIKLSWKYYDDYLSMIGSEVYAS